MAKVSKAAELVSQVTGQPPAGFERVHQGPVLKKEGDEVCGVYRGVGKPRIMTRGKGKKQTTREVTTYKVETADKGTVEILGGAQIEAFFSGLKAGTGVWIKRSGQADTSAGNRVNTYEFAVQGG